MNKKGQTLILFVILLPIFLLLMAFVVDTGIVLKENTKCKSMMKTVLKTTYENRFDTHYQEQVEKIMKKNTIPIENLKIKVDQDIIYLENEYEKKSIFGSIIGIKEYKIKVSIKGKIENETLKIIKE